MVQDITLSGILPGNHGIGPLRAVIFFMPGLGGILTFHFRISKGPARSESKIAAQTQAVGILLCKRYNFRPFRAQPFLSRKVICIEGFTVEAFPVQRIDESDFNSAEIILL